MGLQIKGIQLLLASFLCHVPLIVRLVNGTEQNASCFVAESAYRQKINK